METTILQHGIKFWWRDESNRGLCESDIDHIKKCIEEGYREGDLCQLIHYGENEEAEIYGWWEIAK